MPSPRILLVALLALAAATTVKLSRLRERNGKLRYTCMSWWDDETVTDLPAHGSLNPFNFRPCKAPPAPPRAAPRGRRGGWRRRLGGLKRL